MKRLVDEVDREAAAQEDVLEPFAPVRRRLPSLGRLPVAVPEDEGKVSGVDRKLIENVGRVAVQSPSRGVCAGGVVRPLLEGVEGAGGGDARPADSEAALLLNHQRLG